MSLSLFYNCVKIEIISLKDDVYCNKMIHHYEQQVNKDVLQHILNNPKDFQLKSLYQNGYKITDYDSIFTLLSNFLNSLDVDGKVSIDYKQKGGAGRLWPKATGITSMPKKIRHTIAGEYNIDIDIQNCHPIFLQHYYRMNNIQSPLLDFYINNRSDMLIEDPSIKESVLIIINGGNPKTRSDFIDKFEQECIEHRRLVMSLEKDLYERIKRKKSYNVEGGVVNWLMLEMENKSLCSMVKYLKRKKVKITSLAYDGLTIEKTEDNESNLDIYLRGCEAQIKKDLDVDVTVLEKPMNKGYNINIGRKVIADRRSPMRLLKKIDNKCMCHINHSDMFNLLYMLKKELNITSFNSDFNKIGLFLFQQTRGECMQLFINNIAQSFDDYNPTIISQYCEELPGEHEPSDYEQYNWTWIQSFLSRRKEHSQLLMIVKKQIKTKVVNDEEFKSVNPGMFDENDDVFAIIDRYRKHTFPSKDILIQDFIDNIDKYVKAIALPRCFIINKGGNNIDIVNIIPINTLYQWVDDTGVTHISQIDTTEVFMLKDLRVSRYLPLYKNITFQPNQDDVKPHEFNMYPGFQAKRVDVVDMDLIQPILNHIKTCWADDDEDIYDYILHWFHKALSQPWEKTGVVLLLYGLEGTGKGLLIDNLLIPYIYGDNVACVSQGLTPITQRFNSICMNKTFICCNEVSTEGGFHTSFEKLKALITDKTISIEKKGIDIFKDYPNFINFIFTTNNTDSVKLGKSDRRYCCLETSPRYKGNYDYFDVLLASCNQEVGNHLYTYFCDFKKTRNIRKIPTTKLKQDMMLNATTSMEKYIQDVRDIVPNIYCRGPLQGNIELAKWDDIIAMACLRDGYEINARDLYHSYCKWCCENNEPKKSQTIFGRGIKSLLQCARDNRGIKYILK